MRNFYLTLQLVSEERLSFYTLRQLWDHYLHLYIFPNSALPFFEKPPTFEIPSYFYGQLFHILLYGVSLS